MSMQVLMFFSLVVWLVVLTVILIYIWTKVGSLIKGRGKDFFSALESVSKNEKDNLRTIAQLKKDIQGIRIDSLSYLQRTGLVRFNPFNETGGDHSFSLTMLDGNNNGIIITSLHSRERTRLYLKPVRSGVCEYNLSQEEKKSLNQAIKNN